MADGLQKYLISDAYGSNSILNIALSFTVLLSVKRVGYIACSDNLMNTACAYEHDKLSGNQSGRVVKALDLSSNGCKSAWVRTPPLVCILVTCMHFRFIH